MAYNYQQFHNEVTSRAYARQSVSKDRDESHVQERFSGSAFEGNSGLGSHSPPVTDWHRNTLLNNDDDLQKSNVNMPPPLPHWIWAILVATLGITSGKRQNRFGIATLLHMFTLTSAFVFGACGLFFNVYDTLSEFTKTTVLVGVAKSVLGLYWIGLGIYANSLAGRLFSNSRMVDCIRLHSKTFLKVNTAFIVALLSVAAVMVNLYTNQYMLEEQKPQNGTLVKDANCVSVGIHVVLCKVYFSSKVFYSCFCLAWNLLVVGIFLSVCRTHTISIRQFMTELLYDTKIFVEFCKIQNLEKQSQFLQSTSEDQKQNQQSPSEDLPSVSNSNIWDDDIVGFDLDTDGQKESPTNAHLLETLKMMRISTIDQLATDMANSLQDQVMQPAPYTELNRNSFPEEGDKRSGISEKTGGSHNANGVNKASSHNADNDALNHPVSHVERVTGISPSGTDEESERNRHTLFSSSTILFSVNDQAPARGSTIDQSPPIMSNGELLFIYFQLLRRLSSTSQLLQRWIANWITFVMLWCALLIVYWTNHTAQISGIIQFLIPLVALGLLTSGYAEVNFEGERLPKCILPTEERMPVIYYFQNSKLELKIFSFTMTYNTIVTVVAGIAVTFATRIILDQFNLGKGHLF